MDDIDSDSPTVIVDFPVESILPLDEVSQVTVMFSLGSCTQRNLKILCYKPNKRRTRVNDTENIGGVFTRFLNKTSGSNVRKKTQSLVVLVDDKERIQEVSQKAATSKDNLMGRIKQGYGHPQRRSLNTIYTKSYNEES
ncbi:hypothetical protein RND71_003481 [Anisodus tanguticus]|uniref:Uncharacterized protein n=1 Tax=Anisodus tanguticus TaxID=243964 RepID=A0AAE1VX40_9SOLA|nr:hypothetical protein RND71_003481 [Anisodus tanguticus]